jgi:type III restriction enzyme
MLQEAIDLQRDAVKRLVELTEEQNEITFKAPTGSGKTYMMADMMNNILKRDKDVVFLVSTLSKGDLATQNYEKFEEYSSKGDFKKIKPYLISTDIAGEERLFIPTGYNVYLLPRDLYKKDGRLMRGPMEDFLHNLTMTKELKGEEKKVYLVKDECHIATNNLDNLSSEFFARVYNFSATPKLSRGQYPDVEIKNDDAVDAKLIKDIELIDDENIGVAAAIQKFGEIKKQYHDLLNVNPCLIIQISNKDKADEELQDIHAELNRAGKSDLKWMLIVNNEKECDTNDSFKAKKLPVKKWKDYAKENLSTIDVIIFKMVITEGWDIPRACMLYQMRDSNSKQLDEQVMGRVRRNPRLTDFESLSEKARELAMRSWIWGIAPKDMQKSYEVKLWQDDGTITDEIKIKTTRLKDLTKKRDFDVVKFLQKQPPINAPKSIFKLYDNLKNSEVSIKKLSDIYSKNYEKWREFTENIEAITAENNQFLTNYKSSMEVEKDEKGRDIEVSSPFSSHYTDHGNYVNLSDWVWRRDDDRDKFSFDSEAEKEWAELLRDLVKEDNYDGDRVGMRVALDEESPRNAETHNGKRVYLWGKNYVANSPIKFEYYLGAVHSSYPDFVMKDSHDRIHIFEVKSVNESSSPTVGFDEDKYKAKVEELKKAYKQASKITSQIFYIPIMSGDDWRIFQYIDGDERVLTRIEFEDFCKSSPAKEQRKT